MMSLEQQLEKAQEYRDKYREQVPIDSNITLWFESIIESLHRLINLEK